MASTAAVEETTHTRNPNQSNRKTHRHINLMIVSKLHFIETGGISS